MIDYSKRNDSGEYIIKVGHKGEICENLIMGIESVNELKKPLKFVQDVLTLSVTLNYCDTSVVSISESWLYDKKDMCLLGYNKSPYTIRMRVGDSLTVTYRRTVEVTNEA